MPAAIRNVAIIAHVDHGKTTLVDGLLRQTGTFSNHEAVDDCVMDSNELERERGITILSKNTVVSYQGTRINIIDTPGHADFGGEVERVLSMADGVLLLVDAAEGPMPQTRFVLQKAFAHHLKPIVVVNKIDKPDARAQEVVNEVFDLFIDLDADEDALEFPVFYGSGRQGWMTKDLDDAKKGGEGKDLETLFEEIVDYIPAPEDDPEEPLQFRVTTLDWSDYVGRIAIGRVHRGRIRPNDRVMHLSRTGKQTEVTTRGVYRFVGLSREEADVVEAGDLCGIYGVEDIEIGDTLAAPDRPEAMPVIAIDEPTMTIVMRVNDSPFAGRDGGRFLTSRHLRDRLEKELRVNVALRVEPGETADAFRLSGRGVMHLGFLLETMRREGYEFGVGKPQVLFQGRRRRDPRADRVSDRRCAGGRVRQGDRDPRHAQGRAAQDGAEGHVHAHRVHGARARPDRRSHPHPQRDGRARRPCTTCSTATVRTAARSRIAWRAC